MSAVPRLTESVVLTDFLHAAWYLPDDERRQFEAFTGAAYDHESAALGLYQSQGPKWALLAPDDEPLAVGGYRPVVPGTFDSFMLVTSRGWTEYGRAVTRQTIRAINKMFGEHGARRLQTLCLADRKAARGWYEKIGLQYESTLVAYGANGADAVMYTKVKM